MAIETPSQTETGNYGSLRRMAGSDPDESDGQTAQTTDGAQGQDPNQALANVTNVLRKCSEEVMSIAGQNPKWAKSVRGVRSAISQLMADIASNPPGDNASPAPRTGY